MKATYLFTNEGDTSTKLYFILEETGEVVEVSMQNADYIASFLKEQGVADFKELEKKYQDAGENGVEVYKYSYKKRDGDKAEGYTLDKPFPQASEPDKSVVTGKLEEVIDNGIKVAFVFPDFIIVRSYYVFDEANKKAYPVKAKKDRLLEACGVKDFKELKGKKVTFIRQKAGKNFYYDPSED